MVWVLLFISSVFAANNLTLKKETLYSDFLKLEKASEDINYSLDEYLSKTLSMKDQHCKKVTEEGCELKGQYSMKELITVLGNLHNMMMDSFYSGSKKVSLAKSFSEAIDGQHTPDSHHYAALVASALSLRGVSASFFKAGTLTGLYFGEAKGNKELYWCILTPLAPKPAQSKAEYVKLFNKFKNPKINGTENIKETDIYFMDDYDFKYTYGKKSDEKLSDNAAYGQKILAPKADDLTEKNIDLSEELAKPVDPVIGADAISAYEGSVDTFALDGRIYASTKLSDKIKYESIKNITQIKKCAFDNGVKDARVILKYVIDKDGKISKFDVDNVSKPEFKACIEPVAASFNINKDLVNTDVKVMQIIKL
jgi:hypothetical protein